MNIALPLSVVFCIVTILPMAGCTANKPFRTSFDPPGSPSADPTKAVIESTDAYKLGFVEFDDQGWFWSDKQRTTVEQMIRTEAGIASGQPATVAQGIVLVTFVHGWKDNAASDGDGVKAFRDILEQLSKAEQAQSNRPPRKIVGVYVGWRGMSATWEPFKELSFWERKDTAHKVGGFGAMTELLVDLENIQQDSQKALANDVPPTELIIIGHSFGGAAVYSALSQIITERFVNTVEKGQRLKPLGDQVILLNPAFEAARYWDLNAMALAVSEYPKDQRPVLSIFTSQGDWATHYVFSMGRFFSTLFDSHRDSNQESANLQAVGWFDHFITHTLVYDANATTPTTRSSTLNPMTRQHELPDRAHLQWSRANIETQRGKWVPGHHAPQTYTFDDSILKPRDDFRPGDPFVVVSVDPKIMKGHTDITNPVLINFIREYIEFCRSDVGDRATSRPILSH